MGQAALVPSTAAACTDYPSATQVHAEAVADTGVAGTDMAAAVE
jgi:hypothetical protein